MSRWFWAIPLAVCVACGGPAPGEAPADAAAEEPAAQGAAPKPSVPTFREVTLPAGTSLRLSLLSAVASDSSQVEDAVRAELREAVVVDGDTILPAGTELSGTVTEAVRSGRVKGRARVSYRFNAVHVDGERLAIRTGVISHEAAATKGEDAKKIAIGAGAGAAVGAVLGGGSGAAKGAAIGGAGGTGAVLATRGDEVRRAPGASVTTRLTAPLTVRVRS